MCIASKSTNGSPPIKWALCPGLNLRVQVLSKPRDSRLRTSAAAELRGNLLDPARPGPFHDHLRQRQDERFFRSLIPVEQFRREASILCTWDLQGESAYTSRSLTFVEPILVTRSGNPFR
jgi:hypothetical protein